jgi:hypothetical protein
LPFSLVAIITALEQGSMLSPRSYASATISKRTGIIGCRTCRDVPLLAAAGPGLPPVHPGEQIVAVIADIAPEANVRDPPRASLREQPRRRHIQQRGSLVSVKEWCNRLLSDQGGELGREDTRVDAQHQLGHRPQALPNRSRSCTGWSGPRQIPPGDLLDRMRGKLPNHSASACQDTRRGLTGRLNTDAANVCQKRRLHLTMGSGRNFGRLLPAEVTAPSPELHACASPQRCRRQPPWPAWPLLYLAGQPDRLSLAVVLDAC